MFVNLRERKYIIYRSVDSGGRYIYTCSTVKSKVWFSDDKKHRYCLKRVWDEHAPMASVMMLNPTEADALILDRSLMVIMNYLVKNGYGGFFVVNLFSFIARSEEELLNKTTYSERYDETTDKWITKAIKNSRDFYIGWGSNKDRKKRIKAVVRILEEMNKKPYSDRKTRMGQRLI